MSFSEKIVERRVSLNMSQKELAERLGVTPTRLNYWEKGKREPDVHYIKALARELGVSGDYLLETESEEGTSGSVTGIGERIKHARLKAECTQQQLADMIGVAKSTVTGYEKGTREPDSLKINAIAKALNVSGDYLLGTEYDRFIEFFRRCDSNLVEGHILFGKSAFQLLGYCKSAHATSLGSLLFIIELATVISWSNKSSCSVAPIFFISRTTNLRYASICA